MVVEYGLKNTIDYALVIYRLLSPKIAAIIAAREEHYETV
jgi:hypothetical protein